MTNTKSLEFREKSGVELSLWSLSVLLKAIGLDEFTQEVRIKRTGKRIRGQTKSFGPHQH